MIILSVNKYYWRKGGSEAVFFGEKDMLESEGHSVIPFSMACRENEDTTYSKYFVREVDYDKPALKDRLVAASKIIYSFNAARMMKKLLSNHSPDLAHFHIFQHQISVSVFSSLKRKKVPIILTLHDLKPICPSYTMYTNGAVCEACIGGGFYNCFVNRCTKGSALGSLINSFEMYFHHMAGFYRDVDRYIAVSKFYMEKMIEYGFPRKKISYLPNFIDASEYTNDVVDSGYVLYFGRLSEEKGVASYIESAAINPEIPHFIVGTGPLEKDLIKKVEKESLSNVSFLGFKSGQELKKILAEALCVVVPSEWYENCPMTVLEGFASGKPVIGANIGGIPELIDQGVDGLLFRPGDVQELAKKTRWVFEHRLEAAEMGLRGRKKVKDNFNYAKHYRGLMSIYDAVIKEKSSRIEVS